MKKKILLALMVITLSTLVFGVISVSAETYEDLTYTVSNGKATITDCNNSASGVLEIPSTIGEYPVTSIGGDAFFGCTSLTSITIPDSVASIGDGAFFGCTNLTCITIPDSVTSIGGGAFFGCSSLTSITIPEGVTSIDDSMFNSCTNLTSITIPDSVTSIGDYAFNSCTSLTSITIPDSVTSIGESAFRDCSSLTSITIPKSVTSISDSTFNSCSNLTSITIPDSVTTIGESAFFRCTSLSTVYYTGDQSEWKKIEIGTSNYHLDYCAKKIFESEFLYYVTLVDEQGNEFSKREYNAGSMIDVSAIEEKQGYTIHFYTDKSYTNEFSINTPISKNLILYFRYIIDRYTYSFVEDGIILKQKTVDYGTIIIPPEYTPKSNTKQYTYTFLGWDGYVDGQTITSDVTFTAKYETVINNYTYKFLDEDGTILKNETVDYGTIIIAPDISDKAEYYLFDYWNGYTDGMTLTEDVTFTAVYKYKDYTITAEGLTDSILVTYNSDYTIEPQNKDDYTFIGYFTEEDGKGIQVTNDKGESLFVYNVVGDLNVYPYFYSNYMNKIELQGITSVIPGDIISTKAIFATDKEVLYMSVTIKYPNCLNFKGFKEVDFIKAAKGTEKSEGEYKLLTIDCIYDYSGKAMPVNENLIPFELEFGVLTDAPIGEFDISIEKATLFGSSNYEITNIVNNTIEIVPKLAESIEIVGDAEIDKKTQFIAIVSPDYTTDKSVVWSVDKENVATISQDGILTPVTNGYVIITATAKDGSGILAIKSVQVIAYAKIDNLDFGEGVPTTKFVPENREYTVYVSEDTQTITLTTTFSGGYLVPNGEGLWFPNTSKTFTLADNETVITLNREAVNNMTNSIYTVKVVKTDGQKTVVSNDDKTFVIRSRDIAIGNRIFLALYDGGRMVDMQTAIYDGEIIVFTTTETYTNAKVMVWDSIFGLKSVCAPEIVK